MLKVDYYEKIIKSVLHDGISQQELNSTMYARYMTKKPGNALNPCPFHCPPIISELTTIYPPISCVFRITVECSTSAEMGGGWGFGV